MINRDVIAHYLEWNKSKQSVERVDTFVHQTLSFRRCRWWMWVFVTVSAGLLVWLLFTPRAAMGAGIVHQDPLELDISLSLIACLCLALLFYYFSLLIKSILRGKELQETAPIAERLLYEIQVFNSLFHGKLLEMENVDEMVKQTRLQLEAQEEAVQKIHGHTEFPHEIEREQKKLEQMELLVPRFITVPLREIVNDEFSLTVPRRKSST